MVNNLLPAPTSEFASIDASSVLYDETVSVRLGRNGQPTLITVSCPDQLGLACDLARCILAFGLDVRKSDFCTDARWCYMLFWVDPAVGSSHDKVEWSLLTQRLIAACPSPMPSLFPPLIPEAEMNKGIYILQTWSGDRTGLLNELLRKLWELQVDLHKVNVLTSPDGSCVGIFCITNFDETMNRQRGKAILTNMKSVIGKSTKLCKLITGSEDDLDTFSDIDMYPTIPPDLLGDTSSSNVSNKNPAIGVPVLSINIDNAFSAAHTLLRIEYKFRRGLLYDCIRVIKDHNLQIAYGRLSVSEKGKADFDLFVLQANGMKLSDPEKQNSLLSRLRVDICNPVRVMLIQNGLHPELLVATTVEKTGRGRPRVLHDVTLVLKMLEICIFKADVVKLCHNERLWEVYRFLLVDKPNTSSRMNDHIVERITSVLMG